MPSASVRALVAALVCALLSATSVGAAFVNFESGHVRPLALSPDGNRLFAVNTPDNRLTIFDIAAGNPGLSLVAEVPVGLEPVAVAARTNLSGRTEVWVVNHLSDSVSVVEIDPADPTQSRVTRTLLVGDEPRDVVFAGSGGNRVFVTCARRGQNRFTANPDTGPQLTTPGVGRADVWAFDADNPVTTDPLRGNPLSIIQLFGDTPRALAAAPGGSIVYAAVFESGNRTTTVNAGTVAANGGSPPPPPGFTPNPPDVGLIVKFNGTQWVDEINRNWSASVPFSLPDQDVFVINADANPPALFSTNNSVTGVGTIIFNMITRPSNGKLFVSNTEALNQVRFEPMVSGHLHESRVTVVSGTTAAPRHLNPHIDYSVATGPQAEIDRSLAFPLAMAFSSDSSLLFVPGYGSRKVGVFNADDLEAGTITETQVDVGSGPSGGGPTGVVFDGVRNRLYVMNRFDQAVSVVANATSPSRAQTALVPLRYDPSPAAVKNGRRFLFDARKSGHGDSACASCHVFGDFDGLAWDLGDPFGAVVPNPNPFRLDVNGPPGNPFHPMKGPMTTQSLRGLANAGPMHWRGDRTGGTSGGDPLDEDLAFKAFNPAFVGLLGASSQLSTADMQAFTNFALTVRYPPNPMRKLDNTLTSAQSNGLTEMTSNGRDANQPCTFCHVQPLGTDGFSSFEGESQEFKIAHQRNLYQKVGMFGVPSGVPGIPATGNLGNQVRGFGFLHDGSIASVFDFLQADVFTFTNGNTSRRNVEAFLMAFDTGLAPAVGQQVTATQANFTDTNVTGRINLLIARDEANECELVVKGNLGGVPRGWVYDDATNLFRSDRAADAEISETTLRTQAGTGGQERTYTCVPPGNGTRIGIDRDEDGFLDRTEIEAGSDPANPASVPGAATTTTTSSSSSSSTSSSSTSSSTSSSSSSSTTHSTTSTSTSVTATTGTVTTTSTSSSTNTSGTVTSSTSTSATVTTTPTNTGLCTTTVTTSSSTSTSATTSTTPTNTGLCTTTVTTSSSSSLTSITTTTHTTSTSTSSTTSTTLRPIPTRSLTLKDRTVPVPEPAARRVSFKSDTRLSAFANRIVPPAPGGPLDPRTAGATVVVYNASTAPGHPTDTVTVALLPANWKAIGSGSIAGYRYSGPDANGPIKSVVLKSDTLVVRGGKANWAYTLDEPAQGGVAVRVVLADGSGWCTAASAKTTGTPPSTAATDKQDKFVAQPKSAPPGSCPDLP